MKTLSSLIAVVSMICLAGCEVIIYPQPEVPKMTKLTEPESRDQLIPLAVGNRWLYNDSGDVATVDLFRIDSITAVFGAPFGSYDLRSKGWSAITPAVVWYRSSQSGYFIPWAYAVYGRGITVAGEMNGKGNGDTLGLNGMVIPKNPLPGDTIAFTAERTARLGLGFVGVESVTVPAGAFPEAYRFREVDPMAATERDVWYVRGVGMVKATTLSGGALSGKRELAQYTVK